MGAAFVIGLICAVIGFIMGDKKGRGGLGALLGFFLSVIGLIIVAVLEPTAEVVEQQTKDVADRVEAELASRA